MWLKFSRAGTINIRHINVGHKVTIRPLIVYTIMDNFPPYILEITVSDIHAQKAQDSQEPQEIRPSSAPVDERPRGIQFLSKIPRPVKISLVVFLFFLTSWIGYATSGQFLGAIDQQAQAIARRTIEQTAAAFLIAKSVNGALSVAASFTVGAGALVNGSIEPGKILHPFDRLIDRFSDYLLLAASAATLTELILIIDASVGFKLVLPLCFFLGFIVYALRHYRSGWRFQLGSLCQASLMLLILLRFGLPLILIASNQGYQLFLAPTYDKAQARLTDIQEKTKAIYSNISESKNHDDQWFFSRWFDNASDKVEGIRAAAIVLKDNFEHFFDAIFTMTAVMALEILLLPLIIGWGMWRFTRRLTGALFYQGVPA